MVSASALNSGIGTNVKIKFPTLEINYFNRAKQRASELSRKLLGSFSRMAEFSSRPVFNMVAKLSYMISTDKLSKMGKEGQALFDKPSMTNGGNNQILALARKAWRTMRALQSKTYKLAPA